MFCPIGHEESIMTIRTFAFPLLASAMFAAGCANHAPPPPQSPPPTYNTGGIVPQKSAVKTVGNVRLSGEIMAACKINFANVSEAPKFDYDKSAILPEDRAVLAQVAACLTTGALKGRALKLVGRTDPRGEKEYNIALGQRRAGSARQYLMNLGVEQSKISETSRGEMDATGTGEAGWEADRRVDILLQ